MPLCKAPRYNSNMGGVHPCGQCRPCRINNRKKKTTRTVLEAQMHEHALFVTLTYNAKFLPTETVDPDTGEIRKFETGVLSVDHLQKFKKRLLKHFPPRTVRFFGCGEYGDDNLRPHYHLVLWGIPIEKSEAIYKSWTHPRTKEPYCDRARLDIQVPRSAWDVGQYCSAYTMKNQTRPDARGLDGRPPEFVLSSKGIGVKSVDALSAALSSVSSQAYIEYNGDIPRVLHLMGKQMPIDRYLRGKILDVLQKTPELMAKGEARYKEEMSALYERAGKNQEIPKIWFLKAAGTGKYAKHYKARILEMQHKHENAQAVLNLESKTNFFNQGRKL